MNDELYYMLKEAASDFEGALNAYCHLKDEDQMKEAEDCLWEAIAAAGRMQKAIDKIEYTPSDADPIPF